MEKIRDIILEHNYDRWDMAITIHNLGRKIKQLEREKNGAEAES